MQKSQKGEINLTTQQVFERQRAFFNTGATLDVDFRLSALIKLKKSIENNLKNLTQAFKQDYNKCEFDVYSTEVALVMKELDYFLRHLKKLVRPQRVATSLINYPAKGKIISVPLGVVLVVSPWNYPFQLTLMPAIGAIAGGNTVVIKPSSKTPAVSKVIKDIFAVFEEDFAFVNCERDDALFELPFDFMFYTGGADFAKKIREKQAKHLIPCVLELGGKSPCIVDADADVELAAKRIAWGKFLNAGQTCVAPDYCVVHESIKQQFVERLLFYIKKFYYTGDALNDDYPYVITESKVKEVLDLIKDEKILCGGNANGRQLPPTVIDNVDFDSPIMQNEIFAPVLPILTFDVLSQLLKKLNQMDRPLAFYFFSNSTTACDYVATHTFSGGASFNETVMHLTEEKLPFGGMGASGYGNYHGKKSYDTFVHYKSALFKGKSELEIKYPPYNDKKLAFLKSWFKIKDK